jgi:heme-degrading monooxygenase HmoA
MYGTVARMRLKAGAEEEIMQMSREDASQIPGFVFQHVYRMDADPQEFYLVVAFESEEAYRTNAASPEQHARYERYAALMDGAPEWHDGALVFSTPS